MTINKALDVLKEITQTDMTHLLITKDKIKIISDPTKSEFDIETTVTLEDKDYVINTQSMTMTDIKSPNDVVTLPEDVIKSIKDYVFYPNLHIKNKGYMTGDKTDKIINILNDTLCLDILPNRHVIKAIGNKIFYDITLLTPIKDSMTKTIKLNIKTATIEKLMQDLNEKDIRILLAYITLNNLFVNISNDIDNINDYGDITDKNKLKALYYLSEKIEKAMKDLTDSYYLYKDGVIYQYELLINEDLLNY